MLFDPPLAPATLLRRYKRFLADIRLHDGTELTAHCANPGTMTGLADPESRIFVSRSDNPKRKLAYSFELTETETGLACVNTAHANRLVAEALSTGQLPFAHGYETVRAEVPYGEKSRVDFFLEGPGLPPFLLEIKSVTLMRRSGLAEFPDTRTERGARHLDELANMRAQGARAGLLYIVQRTDCDRFGIAGDIDPAYAAAAARAHSAGVESWCWGAHISPVAIGLDRPLPIVGP